MATETTKQSGETPVDSGSATESRRVFIQRARAAAAVPVIVALSMTWTSGASASALL